MLPKRNVAWSDLMLQLLDRVSFHLAKFKAMLQVEFCNTIRSALLHAAKTIHRCACPGVFASRRKIKSQKFDMQ